MSHWDSTDSFKQLIHSETKHLTVNEWVIEIQPIHSNDWFIQKQSIWLLMSESLRFNRFIQTTDSFRNKHLTVNEWVIEISNDSFKRLIHSETKHLTVNEWVIEIQLIHSNKLIHSETKHLTVNEWVIEIQPIHSNDWFIQKQSIWLLMSESLRFNWFIQTTDSFRNKAFDC